MIMFSRTTLRIPDNQIRTPIYNAILCIPLLIFSQGVVDKRVIFISLS